MSARAFPGLLGRAADVALDRSIVGGYSRLGPGLRKRWWPADPAPGSMTGRRVVVTGATSGIGTAIADGLAELGATVHVLGRNPDKVSATAAALRVRVPNAVVVEETCDVGDLDAVRTWAADFVERVGELHGLVHNAGTMTTGREESAQGHELSLAVHVLGPHLITHLLRAPLEAGSGSVVWMSSGGMYSAGLEGDHDAIESRDGTFKGIRAYARTKRMQVVLADRWAGALAGTGVRVESMHPGWVATPGVSESLPGFETVLGRVLRRPVDGADTAVWLVATRPASTSPHFWHDRAQRPTSVGWQRGSDPAVVAAFTAYVEQVTGAPLTDARD